MGLTTPGPWVSGFLAILQAPERHAPSIGSLPGERGGNRQAGEGGQLWPLTELPCRLRGRLFAPTVGLLLLAVKQRRLSSVTYRIPPGYKPWLLTKSSEYLDYITEPLSGINNSTRQPFTVLLFSCRYCPISTIKYSNLKK